MFTTAFIAVLAGASFASAAPVERAAPAHYAEGYLESYDAYHTRYLAIGCAGKQGTNFFDSCCRPLLATETVSANRPSYCAAGFAASSEASSFSAAASPAASSAAAASAAAPSVAADAGAAYAAPAPAAASTSTTPAYVAPTTTSTQAPAATTAPASTGTSQYTGGFATYFYQGGNAGACGTVHSDGDKGIAIDGNGFWRNYGVTSEHCGKWINIKNTNNGKTVTAQVWDVCPTCVNDNSLDLSVGAFQAIASESDGMVPISWSWA